MAERLDTEARPTAGDLVAAVVTEIGQHGRLELPSGRRAALHVGDRVIVAYGNRYAPDQFEALVPDDLGPCDLAAAGGVAARVVAAHSKMEAPTRLQPLRLLTDAAGRPINLGDWRLPEASWPVVRPHTIVVVGSSMNAGKTTTVAGLIKGARANGLRVTAGKVTGTGAGGDLWSMIDAGACPVLDFTSAGFATTYGCTPAEVEASLRTVWTSLAAEAPDVIVLEIADGLYQQETATLIASDLVAGLAARVVFAAADAMGAVVGVDRLRSVGLPVSAVSGLVTASPLAVREASQVLDVRSSVSLIWWPGRAVSCQHSLVSWSSPDDGPGRQVDAQYAPDPRRPPVDHAGCTDRQRRCPGRCSSGHRPVGGADLPTDRHRRSTRDPRFGLAGFRARRRRCGVSRAPARERVDAERMGQGYTHAMRLHLYRHLTRLSPRTLQTQSHGSTALRFVGDLTAVRRWVSLGLARLVVAAALLTTTTVALARISLILAAAVTVVVSTGAVVATFRAPSQRDKEREVRRRRARLAGNVTEQIAALGAIQVNGAVDREQRRFRRQSRSLKEASVARAAELGKLDAVTEATTAAAALTVLVAAFISGLDGSATAGALAMVGIMSAQVRGLSRVQEYRQGAVVARDAIGRFLAKPTTGAARGTAVFPPGPGLLELDGVAVDESLATITAVASPGRRMAVIGPNGAGKSTLLSVVAQLTEPPAGRVCLDGVDLSHIPLPDVHRAVGLVSSDLPLMRGSVQDNIVYGRPDISDENLAVVVRLCGLDQPSTLPSGLSTPVREQGRALSAGHGSECNWHEPSSGALGSCSSTRSTPTSTPPPPASSTR